MAGLSSSPTSSLPPAGTVLVCQNRTCLKQGAHDVLLAFQEHPVPGYTVKGTGCLGQCGNGPMVRVLPDDIWYSGVLAAEVPTVVECHLLGRKPVRAMLYIKFHGGV